MINGLKRIGKSIAYSGAGALGLGALMIACTNQEKQVEYVQTTPTERSYELDAEPTHTVQPTVKPTPTLIPTVIPTATAVPTATPRPTVIPTPTPVPKSSYTLLKELHPGQPRTINGVNMIYGSSGREIDLTSRFIAEEIFRHFDGKVDPIAYIRKDIDGDLRDDYLFFYLPISFEKFRDYPYDSNKVVGNLVVLTKDDKYYLDGIVFDGSLDPTSGDHFSIEDLTGDDVQELVLRNNGEIKNIFYIDTERFLYSTDTDDNHPFSEDISKKYSYEWRDFLRGVVSDTTEEGIKELERGIDKSVYNLFISYGFNGLYEKNGLTGYAGLFNSSYRAGEFGLIDYVYDQNGEYKNEDKSSDNQLNGLYRISALSFPTSIENVELTNEWIRGSKDNKKFADFLSKKLKTPVNKYETARDIHQDLFNFLELGLENIQNFGQLYIASKVVNDEDFDVLKYTYFKELETYLNNANGYDSRDLQKEIYDKFLQVTFDPNGNKIEYEYQLREFAVKMTNLYENYYVYDNADFIQILPEISPRFSDDKEFLLKTSISMAEAMHFNNYIVDSSLRIFPRKIFPNESIDVQTTQQLLLGFANEEIFEPEIIDFVKRLNPDFHRFYEISRFSAGVSGHTLGLFVDYSRAVPLYIEQQKKTWDELVNSERESPGVSNDLRRQNREANERLTRDVNRAYDSYNQWARETSDSISDLGRGIDDAIRQGQQFVDDILEPFVGR